MSFAKGSVATLLVLSMGSVMSTASSYGRFAFDYQMTGDARSRPVQVFDDGVRTYLQFRVGEPIPALLSVAGDRLFVPTMDGPYVVIAGVPRDFVAQMGLSHTRITHASLRTNAAQSSPDGRSVAPTVPAAAGVQVASLAAVPMSSALAEAQPAPATVPNTWRDNSYATPRRGDQIEWTGGASSAESEDQVLFVRGEARLQKDATLAILRMARHLASAAKVTVIGRDDESYKEGLGEARARVLEDALVTAGVPRRIIVARTGIEQPGMEVHRGKRVLVPSQIRWSEVVPPQTAPAVAARPTFDDRAIVAWDVRASDANVEHMLARWASEARWQLVWRGGPSIPLTGDARVSRPGFLEAASYVITQSRNAGYRVKATAYNNRTIVVESE